jgi:hypothetical protein
LVVNDLWHSFEQSAEHIMHILRRAHFKCPAFRGLIRAVNRWGRRIRVHPVRISGVPDRTTYHLYLFDWHGSCLCAFPFGGLTTALAGGITRASRHLSAVCHAQCEGFTTFARFEENVRLARLRRLRGKERRLRLQSAGLEPPAAAGSAGLEREPPERQGHSALPFRFQRGNPVALTLHPPNHALQPTTGRGESPLRTARHGAC